jgi:CheY-like chemotaxis protein
LTKLILYADDDADDQAWITEACQTMSVPFKLHFVENGKEVFRYLSLLSGDQLPSLIVLDLNMPELDGKQTLQQLKINPGYEKIPVAIVSTSPIK